MQLVGVDPAVEGGVGGGPRGGAHGEAVLGQGPPGAEALDGVAQEHQQPRLGARLPQQARRPHVEHVAGCPLAAEMSLGPREVGVVARGRPPSLSAPFQSPSKKWTSLGVPGGRLTRGWALMRLSHQVVPERAVPTPT